MSVNSLGAGNHQNAQKNTKPLNFRDTYSFRFWLALVTLTLMTQSVMLKFLTTLRTIPSPREAGAKFQTPVLMG